MGAWGAWGGQGWGGYAPPPHTHLMPHRAPEVPQAGKTTLGTQENEFKTQEKRLFKHRKNDLETQETAFKT